MARIKLVPTEELPPELHRIANEAEAHPAIFQAAGHLAETYAETYEAFWAFYAPLKLEGLLEVRLKERLAQAFFLQASIRCEGKLVARFEFGCTMTEMETAP